MADDPRVYSDEEFALILRKAGELANDPALRAASSGGLTLHEMKSAAAQAGLDPRLVERAARMLDARTTASPLERIVGGPLQHQLETHFPTTLDEAGAARLLSAIRIAAGVAGSRDVGHSSAMGMTWHDGGELESLGVTARPAGGETAVNVSLDRRGTLGVVAAMSGMGMFLSILFGVFGLYPESPLLGVAGVVGGVGGVLGIARSYWASSTRRIRDRMNGVMDRIGETLRVPEGDEPSGRLVESAVPANDSDDE